MTALQPLPDSFAATREALHRVAEQIVAPARKPHNEIALRQTPGGFGTPPFDFEGKRTQVRVEGSALVLDGERRGEPGRADYARRRGRAARPPTAPRRTARRRRAADDRPDRRRPARGLLRLRRRCPGAVPGGAFPDVDASEINLWPEHFDIAFEAGSSAAGQRANYGASPGDQDHPEPYVYVGPWTAQVDSPLWNGRGFKGPSSRTRRCWPPTIRWPPRLSCFAPASRR